MLQNPNTGKVHSVPKYTKIQFLCIQKVHRQKTSHQDGRKVKLKKGERTVMATHGLLAWELFQERVISNITPTPGVCHVHK